MQKFSILILILSVGCSLKGQPILIGNWKPVKVSYYNLMDQSIKVIYDKNNIDSLKKEAIKQNIQDSKNNIDSELIIIDTVEFKNQLDDVYKNLIQQSLF